MGKAEYCIVSIFRHYFGLVPIFDKLAIQGCTIYNAPSIRRNPVIADMFTHLTESRSRLRLYYVLSSELEYGQTITQIRK